MNDDRSPFDAMDARATARIGRLRLEKIDLMCRRILDRGQVEFITDPLRREFYAEIRTCVLGMPGEKIDVHRQWPRDWWQAVRERWMPEWWLQRHPVQYDRVSISRQLFAKVCPHLDVPPDDRRHLEFFSWPDLPRADDE